MSLLEEVTDEVFAEKVQNAHSYEELGRSLGYLAKSGARNRILKKRIERLNLSTNHFSRPKNITKRSASNIFIENSTADQSTLRKWYKEGNYTPYVCSICGQEPFWNGKELTLILDHINGHNKDDRLENLRWVCPNCNQQLDTTGGRNIPRIRVTHYCMDCGKELTSKAKRCFACEKKFRKENSSLPISKEELEILIKKESFVKIGKMYHVSDNAVRKWCKTYDLPYTKKEIKKVS